MHKALELSTDDLHFFHVTFDLFPTPESPLRYVYDDDIEPEDTQAAFVDLQKRGLLCASGASASNAVRDRIDPVAECHGRIVFRARTDDQMLTRDFYVGEMATVEYRREGEMHFFGERRHETALAVELAQVFTAAPNKQTPTLKLSAGDYLVFAVFARDLRAPSSEGDDDTPMSVDEVLSYFDEPETNSIPTPNDETWQHSVNSLRERGILKHVADGFALEPALHDVAREIAADTEHTIMRLDYLDEQWLVREVSLFPTSSRVYRVGATPDCSVCIEELSSSDLADVLAGVVTTLPDLLNSDVSAKLATGGHLGRF